MVRTRLLAFALIALLLSSYPAYADTCDYNTRWGTVRLSINYANNHATGSYPHKNGSISGRYNPGSHSVSGTWYQNDGSGQFVFNIYNGGFSGSWKNNGDRNWRGQWNGSLIQCY